MAVEQPVGDVDDVDVLLDDDVAAEDFVHVEIADAGLARVHAGQASVLCRPAGVIEDLCEGGLANVAAMNACGDFLVDVAGAALEVDPEGELLRLGALAAVDD